MDQLLISTLSSLQDEFRPNEFAYLALTTKIELPLRDRWAYHLYQLAPDNLIVAREWRRIDLAILSDRGPEALVELKAMYTFDAVLDQEGISGFYDEMEKDEEKAKSLANKHTGVYTTLLATHPKSEIASSFEKVIKYRQDINRALKTHSTQRQVAQITQKAVADRLKNRNVIASGVWACGEAYDIDLNP